MLESLILQLTDGHVWSYIINYITMLVTMLAPGIENSKSMVSVLVYYLSSDYFCGKIR